MINYEKHTLDNGLRVFLAPMHETQAVTVLFLFGVGSRHESARQNGLSHFLEHMFFKGTEKRPTTLDISQELDTLGAEYNAYTSEERTGYYVSAAAEHFPIAFNVLTDMLYGSVFDSEEINREKGVICEEIKMYFDNPMTYLNEIEKSLVFGDTPLGRDIAGGPKTVNAFTREDFVGYKNDFYAPSNTILVVAGNPAKHDWLSLVNDSLAKIPASKVRSFEKQTEVPDSKSVKIGHKPIDQAHLSIDHYSLPHTDERRAILDVLSNILGGTMSSRLFVEVRERRGLAYYVRSGSESFHDIGIFSASAGVDPKKLEQAVTVIIEQINKLKTEPVTEVELKRAKQNIKGRMSLQLEDSHSIARYLANDELETGKVEQPEEFIARIEKVTSADIMNIANELLVPEKRKLAVVGPLKPEQEEKLAELIKK